MKAMQCFTHHHRKMNHAQAVEPPNDKVYFSHLLFVYENGRFNIASLSTSILLLDAGLSKHSTTPINSSTSEGFSFFLFECLSYNGEILNVLN